MDVDGAVKAAAQRRGIERLQGAEPGRRQVAGDAVDPQAVAPVRGNGDVDDRVVEAHERGEGFAHHGIVR